MHEKINPLSEYSESPHLNDMYDLYIEECKCDREEDGCRCLSFEKFCDEYIYEMKEDQAAFAYSECI